MKTYYIIFRLIYIHALCVLNIKFSCFDCESGDKVYLTLDLLSPIIESDATTLLLPNLEHSEVIDVLADNKSEFENSQITWNEVLDRLDTFATAHSGSLIL